MKYTKNPDAWTGGQHAGHKASVEKADRKAEKEIGPRIEELRRLREAGDIEGFQAAMREIVGPHWTPSSNDWQGSDGGILEVRDPFPRSS